MCSARIWAGSEQGFQRSKALNNPVMIPGVNFGLFMFELTPEILQRDEYY